ncbi:SusC/RagA family TonB-linked outer membrane protein [Chitinophagaceae bacterium LB-8]|uniref:SusC/RagA family TonB-linked outer membrane protein n=1 Tax=Paraflavisolibacter caeni TaxID=2982496 RepID=A0A9X3B701_9BACT|nr:SusC/RagA family TonB-linked outer membrane protein [Paraflavisolibacter caeni]MCU7548690.1 SusC/RagA family TonB-linked outer membrane protein [Paraflavisolibacter caeni]
MSDCALHRLAVLPVFLLLITQITLAQTKTVSGLVTDTSGAGLPGVTITARGVNGGTITNTTGNFILTIPTNVVTLVFTSIGFQRQEVSITDQLNITVTMQTSAITSLNEVVVIGYGTQRRRELTGSVATVGARDFQQGAITTPEQLIAGKVAGVSIISNNGAPGAGSTIRIRGLASLNASNDPLIIVDDLPLAPARSTSGTSAIAGSPDPLSLINPNDIESFTILKDPSSTAIYGSRASNGVVIITTKKGKVVKPVINFNTKFSVSEVYRTVDVFSVEQFRNYVDTTGTTAQKALMGSAATNWQDEIYQTALTTDNNVSITGSLNQLNKMPYRVSAGYLFQEGILTTDELKRTSGGISLSPRLFANHLIIDFNLKGAISKCRFANRSAIGAAVNFDPTQPVNVTSPFGNYFEWATIGSNGVVTLNPNAPRNPVGLLRLKWDKSTVERSFGNVLFDYSFHFLPDLHAHLNLGYDIAKGEGTIYVPAEAAQSWATQGMNNEYSQRTNNKVVEFYFNYNKTVDAIRSNINATAGYGYYDNKTKNYNFPSFSANGDTIAGSVPIFPFDIPRNTLISYYGRLIYTYNTKYIVAASIRTDGSSRFAPDVRWGVFPSVAFTWRVKDEAILKNSKALSDLKLRLSYGVTGNQENISNYSYLSTYSLSQNASQYQFGNTFYSMFTPAAYVSDIQWEETDAYNVGLDYGFINNRIVGSVEYYNKKTKNLLGPVNIPVGSNFTNLVTTNVGNLTNRGFEFSISATPIRKEDFTWDVSVNYANNKTEITNLSLTASKDTTFLGFPVGGITGATGQNIQIHTVGYSPFAFFVFKQLYHVNGKPIEGAYEDLNRDGIINQKDQYRFRSPFPNHILGFNTQVTYRKWSLNTVLRANFGNYVYNNVASNLGVQRNLLNPSGVLGNAHTDILKTGFINNQFQSDYYIQNAEFVRMDNLGINYNAGHVFHNEINLLLQLNCQNVFVITPYEGTDPEIYGGIDNNFYPRPRIFTLGVNLDF